MNLVKSTLAIAIATTMMAPAIAKDVEVYGKANVSFQSADEGSGRFTELVSNASRFGLKGDLKLDDNLTVVYKYEVQIDLADEAGEKQECQHVRVRRLFACRGMRGYRASLAQRNDQGDQQIAADGEHQRADHAEIPHEHKAG